MPSEYVIVTRKEPKTGDLRAAAAEAGIVATVVRVDKGALDIIRDETGRPVLSVQYVRPLAVADEVARVAPAAAAAVPGPVFWTEAWARTDLGDDPSERIAVALARRCDGVCVRPDGSLA